MLIYMAPWDFSNGEVTLLCWFEGDEKIGHFFLGGLGGETFRWGGVETFRLGGLKHSGGGVETFRSSTSQHTQEMYPRCKAHHTLTKRSSQK